MLNNVDCGCFLPFDRGKKSRLAVNTWADLLFRAVIKKKKKKNPSSFADGFVAMLSLRDHLDHVKRLLWSQGVS